MNSIVVLLIAAGMGFLSGLRGFTPLALVSWLALLGWIPLGDTPLVFLGTTTSAVIFSIIALGELIGDKWARMPSRIEIAPLGVRAITGALSATALGLASGQPWFLGVFSGAVSAVIGSFAGYHVRRALTKQLTAPDIIVALIEDAITVIGTLMLVGAFLKR